MNSYWHWLFKKNNIENRVTKYTMPMFLLQLSPSDNNKDVYTGTDMQRQIIKMEHLQKCQKDRTTVAICAICNCKYPANYKDCMI